MVKTKGPMLSTAAAGSLASTVTFSNWKGRTYLKKLTQPTNPDTIPQNRSRAIHSFLTKAWDALSTARKASWQTIANRIQLDPYRAYLQFNLDRVTTGEFPSQRPLPLKTLGRHSPGLLQPIAQARSIRISFTTNTLNNGWASLLARALNPDDAQLIQNTIHIEPTYAETTTYYYDRYQLTTGTTYYYSILAFSQDGNWDYWTVPVLCVAP